jgi:RecB family exonuclease
MKQLVASRRSRLRLERAHAFLARQPASADVLVIAPTFEAGAELSRSAVHAFFGWRRTTLFRCALELARPTLLAKGLTAASALSLEALWARVTHELASAERLHRLAPLDGKPGLARALARSVGELRALQVDATRAEPALQEAMDAYERALAESKVVDRADILRLAIDAVKTRSAAPLLLLDVPVAPGLEQRFVEALVTHSPEVLATAPADDERTLEALSTVLPDRATLAHDGHGPLDELVRHLFTSTAPQTPQPLTDFFSAPGEARECVEIARQVLALAKTGVRFDEQAVLLRSPSAYRAPLEDAFRRAHINAYFATGVARPDSAGRALLALLRCAEEGLSARRFSEYLSLAQVPKLEADGAPPGRVEGPFSRPDASETLLPPSVLPPLAPPPPEEVGDVEAPAVLGQLRVPRRWEQLIVEAAVIGGTDRWRRRLEGLRARYQAQLSSPTASDAQLAMTRRALGDLLALEAFALPLLEELAALPKHATWAVWLEALMGLATRALKDDARVLSVLHELSPMAPVGPLELSEVRTVISKRLSEVTETPEKRRAGAVFIAPVDGARGLSFHTVFVPGLAERVFPQKLREDPLLPDRVREGLDGRLEVARHRVAAERLALTLATGAATHRCVLSYPRIDAEHARPRVPSFYALEAARAVQGTLPGFEALQRQAESSTAVRLAWPAPARCDDAIDDTEYDLSSIDAIFRATESVKGRGRYLVTTNHHLGRALRSRFARWESKQLTGFDGLVQPRPIAHAALEANQPSARPFSPTALEQYAQCPYKFYLSAMARLSPFEVPGELEELGPLEKGSMAHEVQFRLLSALRADGVKVTSERFPEILSRLHTTIQQVAREVYDEFKPAIERVWQDGVQTLEADLREWLRRTRDDAEWEPAHFELAFGLTNKPKAEQDPSSRPTPVTLMDGLTLRGSIDLVERNRAGGLRATDYKTGRVKAEEDSIIGGGRHLQPVLYALVLEQLFPAATVWGGRLHYTTHVGGFTERPVQLDVVARESFALVARTIRDALATGFFPAMPVKGACEWCDYRPVCGPDEERRVTRTRKHLRPELLALRTLRDRP